MKEGRNLEKKQKIRRLSFFLFGLYIFALGYFMFFAEMFGRTSVDAEYHYNLVLFREIKRFLNYREILGWRAVFYNLAGNIIGFMPFGFFLPILLRRTDHLFVISIGTFCLSLCIEVIQLVSKVGSFDVDDLFLNTLGGILGYLVFWIAKRRNMT